MAGLPTATVIFHPIENRYKFERQHNRLLAQLRVVAEHVNRRLKIFRILAERYRNRRKRFSLRFNLIAAILNFELALIS